MKHNKGFTLVEVLFVISVFSVLSCIGFAFSADRLEHQQRKQFIKTFQSDVLYVQQMTVITGETHLLLLDEENLTYTIRKSGSSPAIATRKFPAGWNMNLLTLSSPVSFSLKGTIKSPGTMLIDTGRVEMKVIFPLGKGRSYFVEQ